MTIHRSIVAFSLFVWLFAVTARGEDQQWPRFRGPNGTGRGEVALPNVIAPETALWKAPLPGIGHSSPVIWHERLFLTSADEDTGKRFIICLNAATGEQIWQHADEVTAHGKHKHNSLASSTPAVDGERLYVAWASADQTFVAALDHHGRELWRVPLGHFKSGHGFGISPIVVDDLLVLPFEHGGNSRWIALDQQSGATRWSTPVKSSLHYATPCERLVNGRRELVFANWELGICGVDAATGELRWSADAFDKSHIESSISSPILAGDLVIGVCGWLGHKNEVAAVRPSETSNQAELVWKIDRGAPLCVTPVLSGDLLFLWSDTGIVTCVDVRTGETHWQRRIGGNYYSSPLCARSSRGDRIVNVSIDGEVVVLDAATEYRVVSRSQLGEGTHATSAIADGRLLIRTFSAIYAFGR